MGHFLWLSDLHVDPLYGTEFAVTHHNSMSDDIGNCTQNETLLQYPYGRTGCDSPISLLDSSLQSFLVKNDNNNTSTATSTKIDFILITGDLVRHGTDRLFSSSSKSLTLGDKNISDDIIIDDGPISFTKSILSTTIRSIKKSFPNVPIIPVLGNNDVTPDYYLDVNNNNNNNGTSTNTILDMARDGLSECFLSEEESQTFAYGGYYSRIIQTTSSSSILILSLNTVIYSTNHQPTYIVRDDDDDDDPLGQFGWIESQLQKAIVGEDGDDHHNNNTSSSHNDDDDSKIEINAIWIVGHIPPSIGSYRHSQQWSDRYVDRYITILKKHAQRQQHQQRTSSTTTTSNNFPTIQGHLFGHIHTEEFRLLTYNFDDDDDDDDNNNDGNSNNKKNSSLSVPLFMSSSLTPVYGSNPSYRIVDYDNASGMLLDYTTHYLNLSSSISISISINNDIDNDADDNDNGDDNKNWVWNELPSFTDVYNVSDLSSTSLDSLITRFEDGINDSSSSSNSNINNTSEGDSLSLFETFIKRQHVYSSYEDDDDGDDEGMVGNNTSIEANWVCTLRAISKDAYMQCIEERWSSQSEPKTNHGGIILYLTASTLVIAIGVFVVFFSLIGKKKMTKKRRVIKRRQYRRPTTSSSLDGVEIRVINNNDANNDDDCDSNLSFNSNSINGGGIAMTTIKTATTIGHATAGEFI
jgi:hypothetical protein